MTFSEYINQYAIRQYLEYCEQRKVEPQIDVRIPPKTTCALLKSPTIK